MQDLGHNGKVVLITGAVETANHKLAVEFARDGAIIVLFDQLDCQPLASEITDSGGVALAIQGDINNAGDVQRMMEAAIGRFGHVDTVINNADVILASWLPILTERPPREGYGMPLPTPSATSSPQDVADGDGSGAVYMPGVPESATTLLSSVDGPASDDYRDPADYADQASAAASAG
jgi:NAD(P)-dependent dehydrogenase (short-subunit alcohol dehydrogenase family)